MNLFYISDLKGTSAWFDPEETRHCFKVFRHRMGDELQATDGLGFWYRLRLRKLVGERAELEVLSKEKGGGEHTGEIVLAVSPLRLPDRFEWLLEKAVELGANRIVPIISERTVKTVLRVERLNKIMIAAMKQSCRSMLPELDSPLPLENFLAEKSDGLKIAGFCGATEVISHSIPQINLSTSFRILIGPEGDFTNEEVENIKLAGYSILSFGEARLRTETAAIFALSVIKGLKSWG